MGALGTRVVVEIGSDFEFVKSAGFVVGAFCAFSLRIDLLLAEFGQSS